MPRYAAVENVLGGHGRSARGRGPPSVAPVTVAEKCCSAVGSADERPNPRSRRRAHRRHPARGRVRPDRRPAARGREHRSARWSARSSPSSVGADFLAEVERAAPRRDPPPRKQRAGVGTGAGAGRRRSSTTPATWCAPSRPISRRSTSPSACTASAAAATTSAGRRAAAGRPARRAGDAGRAGREPRRNWPRCCRACASSRCSPRIRPKRCGARC